MTGLPIQFLYGAASLSVDFIGPNGSTHSRNGTGFFVVKSGRLYLVTNRHIVDAVWDEPNKNKNRAEYFGFTMNRITCTARLSGDELTKVTVQGSILFSEQYGDDVSVVEVNQLNAIAIPKSIRVDNCFRFEDLSEEAGFGSEILPCDQIVFPSYGEGHSASDTRPIFRVGWIVSDPTIPLNYEHIKGDALLIEGFSTEGASGAPIIALPKGIQLGEGLKLTGGGGYRPMRIVGVNAGHFKSPSFPHAHISYAFKATIIRRLIEKF